MLSDKNKAYEGWVPAYTIETILIQLQSLFSENPRMYLDRQQV
jgi:ubiquitin-protein ligase